MDTSSCRVRSCVSSSLGGASRCGLAGDGYSILMLTIAFRAFLAFRIDGVVDHVSGSSGPGWEEGC